jgi:hypothetical protein
VNKIKSVGQMYFTIYLTTSQAFALGEKSGRNNEDMYFHNLK